MSLKNLLSVICLCCFVFLFNGVCVADPALPESASAYFPEKNYTFDSVIEGAEIVHDFIMQNKGLTTLSIGKVTTDWGCTAVSYPRQIPPGGEGKITIRVHTSGYGGRRLKKKIAVLTSDKNNPQTQLTVSGSVEKFVTVSPKRVQLRGYAGEKITVAVKIIPAKKYPFKIIGSGAINQKNIRFTIEGAKPPERTGYILTVENLKKETGRYYDMISLKTDSQIKPLIKINVYGYILDPKHKIIK